MPPAAKPALVAAPAPASIGAARALVSAQILSINGLVDTLTDPLRQEYIDLRDRYNAFLTGLPPLEQADAVQTANWSLDSLLRCIEGANELIGSLQSRLSAQLAAVTSGAFLSAADVATRCATASAESAAATELRLREVFTAETTAAAAKAKLLGDRRTLLATAGLPVPPESLLSGAEDIFAAAQTAAVARLAAFKAKGIETSLTPRMAYCSAEEYTDFEALVAKTLVAAPAVVPVAARVEPLAGAGVLPPVEPKKTPVMAF